MLVLTRKVGETVMIGDDTAITVLGMRGGHVRIGIAAPRELAVHREEVYIKIKRGMGIPGYTFENC